MAPHALIPRPVEAVVGEGSYLLRPDCAVAGTPAQQRIVRLILGLVDAPEGEPAIRVNTAPDVAEEGYRLQVTEAGIHIAVGSDEGLRWACQTLRQLMPADRFGARLLSPVEVAHAQIADEPRFGWRGGHLDVSRHFMPFEFLLRHVEMLATHKFNRLHLHLCDDQGWRFESKRFPKLTTVGAWRPESVHPYYGTDRTPHGGFYTQDQLRHLVAHAAALGITVVPEFDFPGHATAALAAYPEFAVPGFEVESPATGIGVIDNVLNLSDASVRFVLDILEEAMEIFPSRWIHIGGDEVPRRQWRESEAGRARAAELGLASVDHLQRWFTEQVVAFLRSKGRVPVGWDEVVEDGPVEGLVCHAWRRAELALPAARAGYEVIVAPQTHAYYDYYQSRTPAEPYTIGHLCPLDHVYTFEPSDGYGDAADKILGTQFHIWTEYIPDPPAVEYMAWPRGCALAEIAWSPQGQRDWEEFQNRLAAHLRRLDALGVNYRPLDGPLPWQDGGHGRREGRSATALFR